MSASERRRFLALLALAQFICSFAGSNMNVMIIVDRNDVKYFFWFNTSLLCDEGIQNVWLPLVGRRNFGWSPPASGDPRRMHISPVHRKVPVTFRIDLDETKAHPSQPLADLMPSRARKCISSGAICTRAPEAASNNGRERREILANAPPPHRARSDPELLRVTGMPCGIREDRQGWAGASAVGRTIEAGHLTDFCLGSSQPPLNGASTENSAAAFEPGRRWAGSSAFSP